MQREIVEVAEGILLDSGVEAVTLESVAGELGMTKQALYHYFPSKEALMRSLITRLLSDEVTTLTRAVEGSETPGSVLATLIQTFYHHYIGRLEAFRTVYCQSQLYSGDNSAIDKDTVRKEINPRTRRLFDVLESKLAAGITDPDQRAELRRLSFIAWLSALGLLTMLGVADAADDPLVHSDEALLEALTQVFDNAAQALDEQARAR